MTNYDIILQSEEYKNVFKHYLDVNFESTIHELIKYAYDIGYGEGFRNGSTEPTFKEIGDIQKEQLKIMKGLMKKMNINEKDLESN